MVLQTSYLLKIYVSANMKIKNGNSVQSNICIYVPSLLVTDFYAVF